VGIIGGFGPECRLPRAEAGCSAPSIIINSIDLKKMLDMIAANELPRVTSYLVGEVQRLARARAPRSVAGVQHSAYRLR
jgi:hypothetical protein